MTRGRMWAYLGYQARDFIVLRAALPTVLMLMLGAMIFGTDGARMDWDSANGRRFLAEIFRMLAGMFITLGAFLGVARMVTDDRANGYYRFLFSKPVSVGRFYAQQWLLHGLGLVVLVGLLASLMQAISGPVPVGAAMAVMALTWLLVGGLGFLLTAATNADALLLVVLYVLSTVLRALRDAPESPLPAWLSQLTRAFPPTQKLDYARAVLYAGGEVPWLHVAHVAAYGALAFAAGVVVLRRSSIGR